MLKPALAATAGVFLLLATAALGQVASPPRTTPEQAPERQLTFAQGGLRLSLENLALGQPAVTMTLIIQNDRDTPVHFAALYGRTASGSQVVLSDNNGNACTAETNPVGIAAIPHLSREPKPAVTSMTTIPPRSRMNAVFRFTGCRLSGPTLSLAGEFALSTDGGDAQLVTVPFWGIVPETAAR